MREREGLIRRIRQLRLEHAGRQDPPAAQAPDSDDERWAALEQRLAQLEQLVEGLQDSIHREAERNSRLTAELQAQMRPAALAAALSQDARERGL